MQGALRAVKITPSEHTDDRMLVQTRGLPKEKHWDFPIPYISTLYMCGKVNNIHATRGVYPLNHLVGVVLPIFVFGVCLLYHTFDYE